MKSLAIAKKQFVFFFVPKSINNLLHRMIFCMVQVYNFLTKSNILVYR